MPVSELRSALSWVTMTETVRTFIPQDLMLTTEIFSKGKAKDLDGTDAHWDIRFTDRQMGKWHVRGTPALKVPLERLGHQDAQTLSFAESSDILGDDLIKLRKIGAMAPEDGELITDEQWILYMRDMRKREYNFAQSSLGGVMTVAEGNLYTSVSYAVPTGHLAYAATAWSDTSADIMNDLNTVRRLPLRDYGPPMQRGVCNWSVMTNLIRNNTLKFGQYQMVQEMTKEGIIYRVAGLDWLVYDGTYLDANDEVFYYIPDNTVSFLPGPNQNDWFRLCQGKYCIPAEDAKSLSFNTTHGPSAYGRQNENPERIELFQRDEFLMTLIKPQAIVVFSTNPALTAEGKAWTKGKAKPMGKQELLRREEQKAEFFRTGGNPEVLDKDPPEKK